jgi:hypothetical protein
MEAGIERIGELKALNSGWGWLVESKKDKDAFFPEKHLCPFHISMTHLGQRSVKTFSLRNAFLP